MNIQSNQKEQQNNSQKQHKKQIVSSRSAKNWQKVRQMMKKISKNQLILTNHNNINKLIKKQQKQLCDKQRQEFIVNLKKVNKINLDLVINSEIIQVNSKFYNFTGAKNNEEDQLNKLLASQKLFLTTYRPVPKINYLVNQKVGENMIDTTGAWVWEAQEVLSYYLMKNRNLYYLDKKQIKILQIGAGCSGLAALTCSKIWQLNNNNKIQFQQQNAQLNKDPHQKNLQVIVTDGREDNIAFLHQNIQKNFVNSSFLQICTQKYIWGQKINEKQNKMYCKQFQLILAADCLFFQQYHYQLIQFLKQMLVQDSGVAIFVNPKRGHSQKNFLSKIQEQNRKQQEFQFSHMFIDFLDQNYQQLMQNLRKQQSFNADSNQFLFMQIRKIKTKI